MEGVMVNTKKISNADPTRNLAPLSGPMADLKSSQKSGGAADLKNMMGDVDVKISPESIDKKNASSKAFDIAKNTSPIRDEKVSALKKQIQEGTYKPDSAKIADGMAREAITEHLAETQGR